MATPEIEIILFSFGHQFGKPTDVDLIIDVRHFPNPSKLCRSKYKGIHNRLQKELYTNPVFGSLYTPILEQIIQYINTFAKDKCTIAIGCEHGRHRSVAIVEKLANDLDIENIQVYHRDIKQKNSRGLRQRQYDQRRQEKHGLVLENTCF